MREKELNLTLCERFRADLAEEWSRFVGGFPSGNCWDHLNPLNPLRLSVAFRNIR